MDQWRRRLLLVEDEPLTSGLLAQALDDAGFEVRTAADARSARALVEDFDPDIALLHIGLGDGPSGVHLAHALRRAHPHLGLLMLTQHADAGRASRGVPLPAGVGFLRKHFVGDLDTLTAAIDEVLADRAENVCQNATAQRNELPLSEHALNVLELIAKGYDNQGIADRMGRSLKSVERWVKEIYADLGISTLADVNPRVEAVRRYISAVGVPDRAP